MIQNTRVQSYNVTTQFERVQTVEQLQCTSALKTQIWETHQIIAGTTHTRLNTWPDLASTHHHKLIGTEMFIWNCMRSICHSVNATPINPAVDPEPSEPTNCSFAPSLMNHRSDKSSNTFSKELMVFVVCWTLACFCLIHQNQYDIDLSHGCCVPSDSQRFWWLFTNNVLFSVFGVDDT